MRIYGLKTISLPMNGGLDEITAVNKVVPEDCIKMENWRLEKDGKRIKKRKGLTEEVTDFAEDVYGYYTYRNAADDFCQLAVLESQIKRKVGAAAWASIHAFSLNIAHPVGPLEVQGKQFIINEVDSRMIHIDGADYRIGIVPPATLPTATASFVAPTLPLDDNMNYADQAAMNAVWADGDVPSSESVLAVEKPDGIGPSGNQKYMRFFNPSPGGGEYGRRSRTIQNLGNQYTLEFAVYFKKAGYIPWGGNFDIEVYNGFAKLRLIFVEYGILFDTGTNVTEIQRMPMLAHWQTYKVIVNTSDSQNSSFEIILNNSSLGTFSFSAPTTANAGLVNITAQQGSDPYGDNDVYIDYIKIGGSGDDSAKGKLSAAYRYAVTYARSGNYPCESNPIKSIISAVTFTGAGLNDMTTGGNYTGYEDMTIKVEIDGAGSPDTIKVSYDNGQTWQITTLALATTIYLHHGITLTWVATTGHTIGNYWTFTAKGCYVVTGGEKVTLTNIPVSTDPQVNQRKLYRTVADGSRFYWLATINDNTTITFTDNIPDSYLGLLLEEDHEICPNGKFSAWWDERLWVTGEDIVYYSRIGEPEHFDSAHRYVTIQKGDATDDIAQLWPYKDSLYVFRRNSIFVIQKTAAAYGSYLINNDVGCLASWSLIEVNNMLMFLSQRGLEVYNGVDVFPTELSLAVDRTMKTIDYAKAGLITAMHNKEQREIWLSLPDRTGGASACTLVYNYLKAKWYIFSFYKAPSCLVSCFDTNGKIVNKMGTRDGCLCLIDSGWQDGATNIAATYRKGWISSELYADIVKLEAEYEMPSAKTLTAKTYVNFSATAARTSSLTGETPTGIDIELRRPVYEFSELGQRAKYFSVEFTNAENVGGDLKINDIKVSFKPRYTSKKVHGE